MRRLVVTENITLDGVIDMSAGGSIRWTRRWTSPTWWRRPPITARAPTRCSSAEHLRELPRVLAGADRGPDWGVGLPERRRQDVGSGTLDDPGWENSTVLRGPVVDEVQALKQAPGRDIVSTGSVQLVHALIAAGLVDEYRLFVFPVVVGTGARLFESDEIQLALSEARPFVSGVVLLRYAPAG
jgi:hypothetical protein